MGDTGVTAARRTNRAMRERACVMGSIARDRCNLPTTHSRAAVGIGGKAKGIKGGKGASRRPYPMSDGLWLAGPGRRRGALGRLAQTQALEAFAGAARCAREMRCRCRWAVGGADADNARSLQTLSRQTTATTLAPMGGPSPSAR